MKQVSQKGVHMKNRQSELKVIKEKLFRCHFEVYELHPWEISLLKEELVRLLRWHIQRGKFKGRDTIDVLEVYAVLKIWKKFGLSLDGFRDLLNELGQEEQIVYEQVREFDFIAVAAA